MKPATFKLSFQIISRRVMQRAILFIPLLSVSCLSTGCFTLAGAYIGDKLDQSASGGVNVSYDKLKELRKDTEITILTNDSRQITGNFQAFEKVADSVYTESYKNARKSLNNVYKIPSLDFYHISENSNTRKIDFMLKGVCYEGLVVKYASADHISTAKFSAFREDHFYNEDGEELDINGLEELVKDKKIPDYYNLVIKLGPDNIVPVNMSNIRNVMRVNARMGGFYGGAIGFLVDVAAVILIWTSIENHTLWHIH